MSNNRISEEVKMSIFIPTNAGDFVRIYILYILEHRFAQVCSTTIMNHKYIREKLENFLQRKRCINIHS